MPNDESVIEFSRSRFRNMVISLFVWQITGLVFGVVFLVGCVGLPWVEEFSFKLLGAVGLSGLLMILGFGFLLSGFPSYKLIFASTIPSTDYYLLTADGLQRYSKAGEVVEEIPFANFADIKMITKRADDNPDVKFRVLGITLRDSDDPHTILDDIYVRWSRRNYQHDIAMGEQFFNVTLASVFKKIRRRWQHWHETHASEVVRERRKGRLRPTPWYKDPANYFFSTLILVVAVNLGVAALSKRAPGGGPGPMLAAGAGNPPANNAPANNVPANNAPANNVPANNAPADPSPLVADWPLDEGQGEVAANKAGNFAAGRLKGASWGSGMKGPCIRLDGRAAYVDVSAASLQFAKGAQFTIAGWANKDRDTGDGVICSFRNQNSIFPVIEIGVRNHQLAGWVRDDTSGQGGAKASGGPIDDGRWHHVALVRQEDGTIEIFLDGASQGKDKGKNSAGAITTNFCALGCDRVFLATGKNSPAFFAGSLGEFRVYNRALPGQKIAELAKER